jgi:hypothetical protein
VDLWTTRIAELPTSPTGLHYDGFSLSSSTRNDEEPNILGDIGTNGNNGVHGLSPPQNRIMNETFPFHHGAWCGVSRNNSHHRTGNAKSFHSSDKYEIIRMGAIFKHDIIF